MKRTFTYVIFRQGSSNTANSLGAIGTVRAVNKGTALAIAQDPAWNIERGCEVLWAAQRRRCWGLSSQGGRRGVCLASWLQGYNPGSEGYGRRAVWVVRRVEAAGREWDEGVEGALGALTGMARWLGDEG